MIGVQIWPHPLVKGWGGDPADLEPDAPEAPDGVAQASLEEALGGIYDTDAHLAPYALRDTVEGEVPELAARLRKEALPKLADLGLEVLFGCVVLDVDAPTDVAEAGEDAVADWYDAQVERLTKTTAAAYRYRTRHGYRLIWRLSEPIGPERYERLAAALRARLREDAGVDADEACSDWTRCYRLPGVVRDGERQDYPLEPLDDGTAVLDVALAPPATPARRFAGMAAAGPKRVGTVLAEGKRNRALASAAGKMRAAGFGEPEILAALLIVNEERCEPPLDDAEVERIARSISRYDAPDLGEDPRVAAGDERTGGDVGYLELGSEAEVADAVLADLEEGAEPLRYDRGQLWQYDPATGVWRPVRPSEITRRVSALDGAPIGAPGKGRRYLHVGARTCTHVRELCEAYRDAPGWFREGVGAIAFAGGEVVRVDDGEVVVEEPSPEHRLTHALPFQWDSRATCPTFERMLERAFAGCRDADERIEAVLGFAGACLVGRATKYQRAMILVGDGANGKSALVDVLAALFPPGARASIPPQLLAEPYYKAELAGALINVVTEVPEADIVSGEGFKAAISGEEVAARRIREAPFRFRPLAGHLWACNSLPGASDFSDGFWRRWLAVWFPNEIAVADREAGIADRVIADELPGVARLVLEAAARVEERGGYEVPSSSTRALEKWRRDVDQIAAFAEDRLERVKTDAEATLAARLYESYRVWASHNGHRPLSHRKFGERLAKLGFRRGQRAANGRRWLARLRPVLGQPVAVSSRSAVGSDENAA